MTDAVGCQCSEAGVVCWGGEVLTGGVDLLENKG